jgi:uracil-DNA glycosylase
VNALAEPLARVLDRAPPSWAPIVRAWRDSASGRQLEAFVAERQAQGAAVYPAEVLRALHLTPRERVRVVILGQDPYHGQGQAEGLAFSVPPGTPVPPSLRNIFQELRRDLGLPPPSHGHLGAWARQGILLLNTSLTVEAGQPASHAKQGWEALTDELIKAVAGDEGPKAFLLWGGHAQARAPTLQALGRHAVLLANHPSPLSARRGPAPFIGCGHFGAVNRFLVAHGQAPLDWALGEA